MLAKHEKPGWIFYLGWVVVNAAAIVVAWYIALALIAQIANWIGGTLQIDGQTRITEDFLLIYVFFPLIGLLTGILQYALLRRYLPRMAWWIAATFLGWLMPFVTGYLIITLSNQNNAPAFIALGLLLMGATVGLPQWWLLRSRVHNAWWWILAQALGWGMTGLLSFVTTEPLPVLLAFALFPALTTGLTCWLLLDYNLFPISPRSAG